MKKIHLIGFILLFALLYLLPLGGRPVVVPNEMRFVEIAKEMVNSGDWVVPRLMGFRYFEKPILGHWMNAGSMVLFGQNHFGARFASAAATGLAALGIFLLVRRERGTKAAWLSAFILLTCAEVHLMGTYSAPDSPTAAFVTLAICCFYPALSTAGRRRAGWLLLVGLFTGLAFLTKGFLAIAIAVMVIGAFLVLQKRWKDLGLMPWWPLAGILAVSLPWSIAVALREGDFWNYFFFEEHINRFFAGEQAQHAAPFWYFIPVLLIGALPWTLIAPIPLFKTFRERWKDPFVQFCTLWAVLPFIFFSASSGKLGTYILPCFPPLAILLAMGLTRPAEQSGEKSCRKGLWILTSIFALAFAGVGLSAFLPLSARLYQPWEAYKYPVVLAGLAGCCTIAFLALRRKSANLRMIGFGLPVIAGIAVFQFCVPESHSVSISMERFLDRQKQYLPNDALVVTDIRAYGGTGFALGHDDDVYLIGRMGEFDYGLAYPDSANRYIGLYGDDFLMFFRQHRNRPIVVVARKKQLAGVLDMLPEPVYHAEMSYLNFYVFAPLPELVQQSSDTALPAL